jgi:hypothetical protein
MQRFKSCISKLENRRGTKSTGRVLCYNRADRVDGPASPDLHVWQIGCGRQGENLTSGPLRAFTGRFMLIPDHGTDAEWMAALQKQQCELQAHGLKKPNTSSSLKR